MRIALITDGIWPYVMGGMQKHSYYLCKYLAQKGVFIDLYHIDQQEEYDIQKLEFFTEEEKKNINSIVVPKLSSSDRLPGHYIRASKRQSEAIYQVYQERSEPVDLLFTKGLAGWKFITEKRKGVNLPPIAIKVHGYEMFQIAPTIKVKLQHFMLRPIFKYVNDGADYIFSYGGKITNVITEQLKIPLEKVVEIPTGIGEDWLNTTTKLEVSSPRRFVFLGRYERRKGIEELTSVLKSLIGEYDFSFEFIGPIPKEKQIVSSQIKYHGKIVEKNIIQRILQKADVIVTPSYSEGMPNVILEAMASACAVIATDVGAVRQMVDVKNGWLIQPANTMALENALVEAITVKDMILFESKSASVLKVKEHFLWTLIADKYIAAFSSLIGSEDYSN